MLFRSGWVSSGGSAKPDSKDCARPSTALPAASHSARIRTDVLMVNDGGHHNGDPVPSARISRCPQKPMGSDPNGEPWISHDRLAQQDAGPPFPQPPLEPPPGLLDLRRDTRTSSALRVCAAQTLSPLTRALSGGTDREHENDSAPEPAAWLNFCPENRVVPRRWLSMDMDSAFSQARQLSAAHAERMGARAIDLLHVACALLLESEVFLASDERQAAPAKAEGLQVALVPRKNRITTWQHDPTMSR